MLTDGHDNGREALGTEHTLVPTLSVIIVNHDGLADTLNCIHSIYRHPPSTPFEIVLIDNYSHDGLAQAVMERFPSVRVAVNERRHGFARNYNYGMSLAYGQYLLVLNNDTLVHAGAIDDLLRALQTNPEAGMAGPRLLSREGRTQLDCARSAPTPLAYIRDQVLTDMGLPLGLLWGWMLRARIDRRRSGSVEAISGACMLVARQALSTVGMLDESYGFYYEDTDWCRRFAAEGYQITFVADALITHLGDQSARKVKVWAKQQEYLGAIRYFRRHWGLKAQGVGFIWLVTLYNWLLRGLTMLVAEAVAGKRLYAREYLYLWGWLLAQQPGGEGRSGAGGVWGA